jgi:outer membrane lipase/esterase
MKLLQRLLGPAALAGLLAAQPAAAYSGLYVLGDSFSDSGNAALVVGADAAQVIDGNGYIPSRPYASGEFSNGDVWVKGFAAALGLAPYALPSLAGGGDFGFGGGRTGSDGPGLPPSLQSQELELLGALGNVAPPGALYVIAGGGNDARDALAAAATATDPAASIATAAAAFATGTGSLIDQLQAAGARDIVVWNVPDLGLAPAVTALGAGASFLGSTIATAMNDALSARLAAEAGVRLFDLFGFQNALSADPAAFGLANVTDACGAVAGCDPSTWLFWDGVHPTSAGHALIAQQMLAVAAVPEPEAVVLLAGGLLLLGLRLRLRAPRDRR